MKKKIEIGNRVSVKTKHFGTKTGTVIDWHSAGQVDLFVGWWIIKPDDHPRNIAARIEDIKIIK